MYRWFGSADVPWALLDWEAAASKEKPFSEVGRMFWRMVMREWSGFDAIPQREYQRMFAKYREVHSYDLMETNELARYKKMPPVVCAYLGGDISRSPQLAWTTNRKVAEGFARGHRGYCAPRPQIFDVGIPKASISFVCNDRAEAELVLFKRLTISKFLKRGGRVTSVDTSDRS